MSKLNWRNAASGELALLLKQAQVDDSRAVGTATVYRLSIEGRDMLAVSLPDGQAVLVETVPKPTPNRRHRAASQA